MKTRWNALGWFLAAVSLLALTIRAGAVIKRIYPLADVIADADQIVVARVSTRDAARHQIGLTAVAALKGAVMPAKVALLTSGGDDAAQTPKVEARLSPGRTVVLFGKPGKYYLGYVEGTWFRLATPAEKPWQFVHLELYLRRTFHGSSAELQQAVVGVISGKGKAPPPDPNATPAVGPATENDNSGPPFSDMPTSP